VTLWLNVDGQQKQRGNTRDMIFKYVSTSISYIPLLNLISTASRLWSLTLVLSWHSKKEISYLQVRAYNNNSQQVTHIPSIQRYPSRSRSYSSRQQSHRRHVTLNYTHSPLSMTHTYINTGIEGLLQMKFDVDMRPKAAYWLWIKHICLASCYIFIIIFRFL